MRIWKLEAIHDLDGALSRFFKGERDANQLATLMHGLGWFCDVYDEDVPEREAYILCRHEATFPLADTETIVASLNNLYSQDRRASRA